MQPLILNGRSPVGATVSTISFALGRASVTTNFATSFFGPEPILLVCNKHEDTMSFVNLATLDVMETISTGPNPHEIVITGDRRYAYLSNYAPPGNTISVIDLVNRRHIEQIPTGEYVRIHGAAIAPDGRFAYFTARQSGYVVEVDTESRKVTRGIPTHGKISHMALVPPDGERLCAANIETGNVSVIERATGELITRMPCGKGVEGMGFTPDGEHLWAFNQEGGSVSVIDFESHRVIETFECPGRPVRIAFARNGTLALVPSWTEKGELIIIEVKTLEETNRVPVGRRAIGVALSPDEKRAFVGCEYDDGVHVIGMATFTVEARIMAGNGSDAMAVWHPPE